jgi:hypothetical protein
VHRVHRRIHQFPEGELLRLRLLRMVLAARHCVVRYLMGTMIEANIAELLKEHVLVNTELHRKKYQNVMQDPRLTVTVWDRSNPAASATSLRANTAMTYRGPSRS